MTTETMDAYQLHLDKLFVLLQTQQYIKNQFPNAKMPYFPGVNKDNYILSFTYELPEKEGYTDNFLDISIEIISSNLISIRVEKVHSELVPNTKGDIEFISHGLQEFSVSCKSGKLGLLEVFDLLKQGFNG